MFCTKCGTVITGRGAFCSACGAPSSDEGAPVGQDARLHEGAAAAAFKISPHMPPSADEGAAVAPWMTVMPEGVRGTGVAREQAAATPPRLDAARAQTQRRRLAPLLAGLALGLLIAGVALIVWNSKRAGGESAGDRDSAQGRRAETTQPAANLRKNPTANAGAQTEPPPTAQPVVNAVGAGASPLAYGKPAIVSRAAWGARAPAGAMTLHSPTRITICHTAMMQQPSVSIEEKMRRLQSFSQRTGNLASGGRGPAWADVPYHFYVSADGRIAEGRDISYACDTNTAYDPTGHILIALEGNFEAERPTPEQLDALYRLTAWLVQSLGVSPSQIRGHRDYAPTVSPGRNMLEEVARLRQRLGG
jgi:N-acetylmuramoyl-L-alanine amidase